MAIDNNDLVYLLDPVFQIESIAGKPVIGGHIEVYYAGTDLKYITYQNFDHTENPFKIPLNNDGRAVILVELQYTYDIYIYDSFNNMICSRLNVKPQIGGGNISIKGRTYHGVEPVVVNNQYNLISARNIPLGVQEPLYFIEDTDSACVIGMSGEYQPVTGMSGYATTGDLVDLTESISETYQPKGDYATHSDLSGFMEESKLETAGGKITGYDGTAFAGGGSVEFIPWSASGNFATSGDLNGKLDTTAFSTVSGDFITAVPDTYATKDFVSSSVSSKLDITAFADVSGDFITALPEGILNESGFEYDGDKISAYNGSAFVGQGGGGGITGEYELSAGNGISIENFPIEQKTVISVTGNYATEDWVESKGYLTAETDWTDTITAASANAYNEATAAIPAPFDPTYLSGQIDTKLDSAIYANDSGTFLTAHQDISNLMPKSESANFYPMTGNPSGFLTAHQSLEDYQTIDGMTAYQPVGSYLTADALDNVSANWNEVSAKLDTTAFSDVSGTFLTAHQSLADYQTTADMANYQTTADMTAYQPTGDYLTTADSANFYTTANESGYITGVPDTYLQNTDLSTTDGKVTAISGIPLSAGGDVPEGVMVESGLEYNAVNEISGYNGSAIAQYGAEKQWLVHDDTLVHAANSAQYALGVAIDNVARLMGVDQTLLFSASTPTSAAELSESIYNFNSLKVYIDMNTTDRPKPVIEIQPHSNMTIGWAQGAEAAYYTVVRLKPTDNTHLVIDRGKSISMGLFTATTASPVTASTGAAYQNVISRIYGIGRKDNT